MFFQISSPALALLLFAIVLGATAVGVLLGRRVRHLSDSLSQPVGALQAALLGVVGLILAFGLSLAVARYENRRAAIVDEANAIGTTYLRAQTLAEPERSRSLERLVRYTDAAIRIADSPPGSDDEAKVAAAEQRLQRRLWALAGLSLQAAPTATAPRLYVESLNEMFDAQTTRSAALNNRVPNAVLLLEVIGAAIGMGLLAAFLVIVGRGVVAVSIASALVAFLLLVTFDLDRPTRGMIQVPNGVLTSLRASMDQPPAARAVEDR